MEYVILPKFSNHSIVIVTKMQFLFAIKQGFQVKWEYLILEHMATHSKNAIKLPYVFFLSRFFFAYFGVNFSNEDPVEMGDFVVFMKVCNNKMGIIRWVWNTTSKTRPSSK